MGWEWRCFLHCDDDAQVSAVIDVLKQIMGFSISLDEKRTDIYFPWSNHVGVKLRHERTLEVKIRKERKSRGAEKWGKMTLGSAVPAGIVSLVCSSCGVAGPTASNLQEIKVEKQRCQMGTPLGVVLDIAVCKSSDHCILSIAVEGGAPPQLYQQAEQICTQLGQRIKSVEHLRTVKWLKSEAGGTDFLSQLGMGYPELMLLLSMPQPIPPNKFINVADMC